MREARERKGRNNKKAKEVSAVTLGNLGRAWDRCPGFSPWSRLFRAREG